MRGSPPSDGPGLSGYHYYSTTLDMLLISRRWYYDYTTRWTCFIITTMEVISAGCITLTLHGAHVIVMTTMEAMLLGLISWGLYHTVTVPTPLSSPAWRLHIITRSLWPWPAHQHGACITLPPLEAGLLVFLPVSCRGHHHPPRSRITEPLRASPAGTAQDPAIPRVRLHVLCL